MSGEFDESEARLQRDLQPAAPSGELPATVLCRRCGAENVRGTGLCTSCRRCFLPSNTTAMTHGARRSLERPEALAAIAGKRQELIQHLGGGPSVIQQDLATDYARVDVLIESVARNIEVGGIFTPKGSTRAAVTMLLSLLDRRQRLAALLGLERKARPISFAETIANANRETTRE